MFIGYTPFFGYTPYGPYTYIILYIYVYGFYIIIIIIKSLNIYIYIMDFIYGPPKIPSFLRAADTFKAPVPRSHAAEEGFPWAENPPISELGWTQNEDLGTLW